MSEMSDRICTVLSTRLNAAFNGGPNVTVRELTVAVLDAIHEPNEEMVRALCDYEDGTERGQCGCGFRYSTSGGSAACDVCSNEGARRMRGKFQAVIDVALVGANRSMPTEFMVLDTALPDAKPLRWCVFECRTPDGSPPQGFGNGRAWCQTHGFDCPELAKAQS